LGYLGGTIVIDLKYPGKRKRVLTPAARLQPISLSRFVALSVSAVSPDCVMATAGVFASARLW
jgi:hypothetical protein